MRRRFYLIAALVVAGAAIFASCKSKGKEKKETKIVLSTENDHLVEAISATGIGRLSDIRVSFVYDVECEPEKAISFEPETQGTWTMADSRTAVFTPTKAYKSNSALIMKADCGKLFESKGEKGFFTHPFAVQGAYYSVKFDTLELETNKQFHLNGSVTSDIPLSENEIKSVVNAKINNEKLPVSWEKDSNPCTYNFKIGSIQSGTKQNEVEVSWSGTNIGLSQVEDKMFAGNKSFLIPSKDDFKIIDVNTSNIGNSFISISFSKAIETKQNIEGFIRFYDQNDRIISVTNTIAANNVLKIYSDNNFANVAKVEILNGLKSKDGVYLAKNSSYEVSSKWEIPAVKFSNNGNILPTSQDGVLPIQTRNLQSVLVQVYDIPARNMNQFLQVNRLDGTNELYRVGEPVWESRIHFGWNDSMKNQYIPQGINLSQLIKKYPNGMFQIRISFRKDDIKYICSNNHRDFSKFKMPEDKIPEERQSNYDSSYWDWYNEMDWEDRSTFWNYQNDPCHPAFYMESYNSASLIKKNVLVSDLGIIAKRETGGKLFITTTDIKNAGPAKGVSVKTYNFIGTELESGVTGDDGCVNFKNEKDAVFVIASYKEQSSFLKLEKGTALSVSHFNTGGEKSVNGVKGFIYGERGVWRPGDNIYLTFILQDIEKRLPEDIPVSFELTDPLGRVIESKSVLKNVNGFYPIRTKTSAEGTTGLYTAKVIIGGSTWTKNLRVETVIPNKLSVKLSSEYKELIPGYNNFKLEGEWLHGAKTPGYKADLTATFSNASTTFDGYSEYTFTNPLRKLSGSRKTLWSGYLGDDSTATFRADINDSDDLPGKINVNAVSRIFEPSGNFSTQYKTFVYSPYNEYVGIRLPKGDAARGMLLTDTDHTADVVMFNSDGSPVKNSILRYKVYKISWKWWWEQDALTNAGYVYDSSYNEISSGDVTIKNGKGAFKFQVKYPDWGRYLVVITDPKGNHSAGKIVYIDWPGWAGRAQEGSGGSAVMLPLITDKKQYNVGQTASITFSSSKGQRALLTLERNGCVIKQDWITTSEGSTVYKLPLTKEMSPNAYAHITLLQPHLQTANNLPIRLYGVVPVFVNDPQTDLDPVIVCEDKFEPNKSCQITVAEKNGKEMTYTLAVVDEGLLGLTNHSAPNPKNEFYKKEASMIESWDLYSYVMNAYSGKLQTILSIGGSEGNGGEEGKEANRFAPVVKYFGPYSIKANEKKTTKFEMPEYVGKVRVMVVAGNKGAYGVQEKSVPVKSDLMVQSVLPRTIGIGEDITVPVTVFNGTEKEQKVTVNFKSKNAAIASDSKTITLKPSDNSNVMFTLKADKAGTANIEISATGPTTTASEKIKVPVMSRGVNVSYKTDFILNPGESKSVRVDSPMEKGTLGLTAELSTLPSINLSSRLEYLTGYPHGCIEQITSGGFPQLYIPSFVDLSDEKLAKVKSNVNSVIERYTTYQTSEGGFGYWPGNSSPHEWGTCYAVHFMLEAKAAGYSVPSGLLDPALEYISSKANSWYSTHNAESVSVQAYRLYDLALAKKSNLGAMNRLASMKDINNNGIYLISAAYLLSGNSDYAKEIMEKSKDFKEYRYTGASFNSSTREVAMRLLTYTLLNDERKAAVYAKKVCGILNDDKWLSTQETAWCLMTLLPYYTKQAADRSSWTSESNGEKRENVLKHTSSLEVLKTTDAEFQVVKFTNTGKSTLYGTLTAQGTSKPGTETVKADGMRLSVKYFDENGKYLNKRNIKKGDNFTIEIDVINDTEKSIENVALTVPISTAWEFSNDRIGSTEKSYNSNFDYQDFRDDKVCTYFTLSSDKTFTFHATAVYDGSIYIPAITAEAMYDATIGAVEPGLYVPSNK